MQQLHIQTYCHLVKNKVYVDGSLVFENPEADSLASFTKSVYRHYKPKYAKFFKMDEISKLGFIAAEVLLQKGQHEHFKGSEVGIVLANSHATFVTDQSFQESIEDYNNFFPSPSVFVYTLPNIMVGEISIRNKLQGENAFFIFENFNTGFISRYINQLFDSEKLKACIGGWVNQTPTEYEAFLYWVSADKPKGISHNELEINKLFAANHK